MQGSISLMNLVNVVAVTGTSREIKFIIVWSYLKPRPINPVHFSLLSGTAWSIPRVAWSACTARWSLSFSLKRSPFWDEINMPLSSLAFQIRQCLHLFRNLEIRNQGHLKSEKWLPAISEFWLKSLTNAGEEIQSFRHSTLHSDWNLLVTKLHSCYLARKLCTNY